MAKTDNKMENSSEAQAASTATPSSVAVQQLAPETPATLPPTHTGSLSAPAVLSHSTATPTSPGFYSHSAPATPSGAESRFPRRGMMWLKERRQRSIKWRQHMDEEPKAEALASLQPLRQEKVGLKNAGATCYMNAVLQQVFSLDGLWDAISTGAGHITDLPLQPLMMSSNGEEQSLYYLWLLKETLLLHAKLQQGGGVCEPRGLWENYRLGNGVINPMEQQDAGEFLSSLVHSLDAGLAAMGEAPHLDMHFGGTTVHQKISLQCPHSHQREEKFIILNVDICNQNNLHNALDSYLKDELLEGANAYHCEACDYKVDTLCQQRLKRLPEVLVIQLNRTSYDIYSEQIVKSNHYFEFPHKLEMSDFTIGGVTADDGDMPRSLYRLRGIIVHRGDGQWGHYYSFIRHRGEKGSHWLKYDDEYITECDLHNDMEMQWECFGGRYYDFQQQSLEEQTWTASILFYETWVSEEEPEKIENYDADLFPTEVP